MFVLLKGRVLSPLSSCSLTRSQEGRHDDCLRPSIRLYERTESSSGMRKVDLVKGILAARLLAHRQMQGRQTSRFRAVVVPMEGKEAQTGLDEGQDSR